MSKPEEASQLGTWLDRLIVFWLFFFAAFAPHSIAFTQGAWLIGALLWVIRFFVYPPPRLERTPVDYALLGFFILTGLSSLFSYEPMVSIGKLRAASLFTIVYLFAQNIPSRRIARLLAVTLVASCMINVFFTFGQRIVGRGVKVGEVSRQSPLSAAVLPKPLEPFPIHEGDTILEVDGQRVRSPDQIAAALNGAHGTQPALVKIYRVEWEPTLRVPRGKLLSGTTAEQQLGVASWSTGRDWRAVGFYGHWTTYSEMLQFVTSLALGLLICLPTLKSKPGLLLMLAIAGMIGALLLTVTRASWLGLLVSATLMVLIGTSRRTILILAACALPLVVAGLFLLHQKRNVGFIDQADASTTWRQTVWHEGFDLLISKPRHLLIGVGMDSIKAHWREWGLFDNGRIPAGHMHSDYLELALERGVPALIVWLILLGVYARTMLRQLRRKEPDDAIGVDGEKACWMDRGIVLGALGGLAGFMVSGTVHYNWGDSEVVMVFYLIMGLTLAINRLARQRGVNRPS